MEDVASGEAFADLADVFERINSTTKRKEITEALTGYLRALAKRARGAVVQAVYLSIARVSSESGGLELNVGEHLILKAVSEVSGGKVADLRARMKQEGDISAILSIKRIQRLPFRTKRKASLEISDVYKTLQEITEFVGKDSSKRRVGKMVDLLSRAGSDLEAKYILRLLDGRLKIGLSTQTVISALARAFKAPVPSSPCKQPPLEQEGDLGDDEAVEALKESYSQLPSFSRIVPLLIDHGVASLPAHCAVTPGYPLRPMLAMPEKNVSSVIKRFTGKDFTCEYKYDGERIQVHRRNGEIKMFSRGLENSTDKFVPHRDAIARCCKDARDFILDGEMVAYDRHTDKLLPFQTLSARKRKLESASRAKGKAKKEESDVCLFVFDVLYLGQPLLKKRLPERREVLREHFTESPGEFAFAQSCDFAQSDAEAETRLEEFFSKAVAAGCEGLIVKSIDDQSTYEPSKRSMKWVKLKSDYITGFYETFDLIVIGGYFGKGRRKGKYGGFLLACPDEDGELRTLTRLGTGFSDALLDELGGSLEELRAAQPVVEMGEGLRPDVWFSPKAVWEIQAAGITASPRYTAGAGRLEGGKGLSLRFPRFVRIRDDKTPDLATSNERILAMFRGDKEEAAEEEYYY